jgi:hypothetical protein
MYRFQPTFATLRDLDGVGGAAGVGPQGRGQATPRRGYSGTDCHSPTSELHVSTFCGLPASIFRLDVSTFCGLLRDLMD